MYQCTIVIYRRGEACQAATTPYPCPKTFPDYWAQHDGFTSDRSGKLTCRCFPGLHFQVAYDL